MRIVNLTKSWAAVAIFAMAAMAQDTKDIAEAASRGQVQIPNRPGAPLFQGEQGSQKAEIRFDAATAMVTAKVQVQDPNGYFIPNIRRENFAVYDNGVRQHNESVEIEHSPVWLAVLMEWVGRYQALNKALGYEVPRSAHQLLDQLGNQDRLAIWRYGDRLEQLADFSQGRETWNEVLLSSSGPEFSESNFYDGLAATLQQMRPVSGRKALVLISTGVDTFSRANYEDVLREVRDGGTPVYIINVGPVLRRIVENASQAGPYAKIDWNLAEKQLQQIANSSGGRMYTVNSTFNLSAVYDDIMENLRVRYVISYKPSNKDLDLNAQRTVRIELVNPKTGAPLEIIDADGKPVLSKPVMENQYSPQLASMNVQKSPVTP